MKISIFYSDILVPRSTIVVALAWIFMPGPANSHFFGDGSADLTPPVIADVEEFNILQEEFGGRAPALRGVFNQLNLWNPGSSLKACFYDGEPALKAFFSRVARAWLQGAALQIDFGNSPAYRDCSEIPKADMRITFAQKGNWSFVGTDSLNPKVIEKGPSLSIETKGIPFERLNKQRMEEIVLHEVGHALGLLHEHQSPESKCEEEFNWGKIFEYGRNYLRWDERTIRTNFEAYFVSPRLRTTPYDKLSIMHYSLPEWMFKNGKNSRCYIRQPTTISNLDRSTILAAYPAESHRQDKQLQSVAEIAGALMGDLNLNATQVGKIGQRISTSMKHFKRKLSLHVSLNPQGSSLRSAGDELNPCEGQSVKLAALPGVSCGVTPDASMLVIEVDPSR
jgi:Astacin (Peptidase family M12A)